MRGNNIFKYIFIFFAIGIIFYAGYTIYNNNKNKEIKNNEQSVVTEEKKITKNMRLALINYDSVNPLITHNKEMLNIDTLIYEPLFTLTNDYQLQSCLAKECSKTGDKIYIIKMNKNILWQNDTPFTAKDVLFTIDLLKKGNSIYKYNVDHIENVEIIDEMTLKLTLDSSDIQFFEYNLIFPIMSSDYYEGEDFYSSSKIPIGTGKFKITNVNTNNITLAKNEKWKNYNGTKEIKIENISVNIYSSMGEVYNSFKKGDIDLINTSNPDFQEYIGTIGFNERYYPGREFDFLSFNCEDLILKDKSVRKAISYAIDKSNVVSTIFNNKKNIADYPLDYGNYLYTADNSSLGYNPEQAKKVLEEGGWLYRNNRWTKNIDGHTKTLKLKLSVDASNEQRVAAAELILKQLKEIGIDIRIEKVSHDKYNSYIDNKDYQILFTGVYTSYIPDLSYYFLPGNISNYSNSEIEELIDETNKIKDVKKLKDINAKIYNIYKDEVPFIGLFRNKNITITSEDLIGVIEPNNYMTFYNIEEWYRK